MLDIHPTAVVHPKAGIDDDVEIGPYSVIGPHVTVGAGTRIGAHAVLEGHTSIGRGNRIFHGAALGGVPQDLKYRGETTYLRIGDHNTIREYATLNVACIAGESTVVGDHSLIMAYAHVAHNCRIGSHVILANSVNLAGHVLIFDYAIVGGVTPVHQFVRIGSHAIIGGGCRVPKDVPPFAKAAGNPLRVIGLNSVGLERHGFDDDRRAVLKRAFRLLFRSGLNISQAVERLRAEFGADDDVHTLVDFIESSERGVHT
ncbi:MAG: acyl-ACP--UDP-N-acetylglucosamine O-acyltransferase [Candidatus Krumholzibacteriia bacterium]